MLAAGVKDIKHCGHGHHMVPRNEMTKMLSDNGKVWRSVCVTCKELVMERRRKAKQTK